MKKNSAMPSNMGKKSGVAEDIERLKQRREDRKNKNNNDGVDGGNKSDAQYENLMKKKKIQFNQEPENVRDFT